MAKKQTKPLPIERRLTKEQETVRKELVKEMRCDYLPGSLRQIEMISDWFERASDVTVYLLKDECSPDPDRDYIAEEDDIVFNPEDSRKFYINNTLYGELSGSGLDGITYMRKKDGIESELDRPFRRLSAFLDEQRLRVITGLRLIDIAELPPRDYMPRYCFTKLKWNARPIENVYFNREERMVLLQLGKPCQ